jgi:hypothetical protein
MKTRNVLAVCLIFWMAPAFAAILPNANNSELRLGNGIDPDIERVFESCVEFSPDDVISADGVINSNQPTTSQSFSLSTDLVTSSRQVDEYTHTSVSASVQYMAYSGSFSVDASNQYNLSTDQLALGIKADAEYGRWFLNHVHLKPEMKALAKRDLKQFYKRCGHEFISGYKLGQGISVLLTTFSQSEFSKQTLDVKAGVKASIGALAVGVEGAFTSVASSLLKYGSLQIKINGFGGGPLSNYSAVITTDRDVKKFSDEIAARVAAFKLDQSTKTYFMTSQYPEIQNQYLEILYNGRRNALQNLYSDYRKVAYDLDRLRKIVRTDFEKQYGELCKYKADMTCKQYGKYLADLVKHDEDAINAINEAARKCVAANDLRDCATPNIYTINPGIEKTMWPEKFKLLLYQAQVDAIRRN